MKKFKIIVNILLVLIVVSCIVALSLAIPTLKDHIRAYNSSLPFLSFGDPQLEYLKNLYSQTICSIIFSALSAIASALAFILLNFKVWKKKD